MIKNKVKGYKGKGMDGIIARFYDKNAKEHIIEQYKIWVQELIKLLPKNAKVLEVASGPGYLSIELVKAGINKITGMDISESFIEISKNNAKEANVQVDFIKGNASEMPFDNNKFTHIICTSAFKNFSDPLNALKEMHRVLIKGGFVWLSDMRQDVSNLEIDKYVNNIMKLKGFNSLITKLTFKYMLRKRAYTKTGILELASKTSFKVKSFKQNALEFYLLLQK